MAQLNKKISEVPASGGAPNDLLDARNETMRQLSTLPVHSLLSVKRNVDIYLGSGQPLVIGNTVNKLEAVQGDDRTYLAAGQSWLEHHDITIMTGGEIGGCCVIAAKYSTGHERVGSCGAHRRRSDEHHPGPRHRQER
jgi:flagellar hook-associated protein 1 FlgK